MTRREFWEREIKGAIEAPLAKYAYGDHMTHLFFSDGVFMCSRRTFNGTLVHKEFRTPEEVLAFAISQ